MLARTFARRGLLRSSAPKVSAGAAPAMAAAANSTSSIDAVRGQSKYAAGSSSAVMMAGSPLFFTNFDKPVYFQEAPFAVGSTISGLIERVGETEGGPLFLGSVVGEFCL